MQVNVFLPKKYLPHSKYSVSRLFLSVHCTIPRDKLFGLSERSFLDVFEVFCHSNLFGKGVFCLGIKQGMSLKNECSPWYNRRDLFSVNLG